MRLIYLFVFLCFFPFCLKGSVKDSIKKTYTIVLHGRYCPGPSERIIEGKYRIREVCAGCGLRGKILRKNKRTRRIIKRKFGLDY